MHIILIQWGYKYRGGRDMSQSMLNVSIDDDMKRRFDAFCSDAGMNASVAVNLFVHAVVREKRIPFDITGNDDPFYSTKNQARLMESIEQLEAGLGVEHELIEVDDE
jgi:DNA-damage-inducible protein J